MKLDLSALNAFLLQPRRWLPLNLLLLLALFARLPSMASAAHEGDLRHFAEWMRVIDQQGVWQFYDSAFRMGAQDRTYPPLSTLTFDVALRAYGFSPDPYFALADSTFIFIVKIFPVLCEIALVAAVYVWLMNRLRLRWLIPGALALVPGLIATTAWWGQYEAPFTLFVVLALLALNRDRPLLAWLMFGVALLLKQPAIVVAPVLLTVTFRRFGWGKTLVCMIGAAAVYALVTLPFALNSGLTDALSPYLQAGDAFPYLSNNAYNLWFGLATLHNGELLLFRDPTYADSVIAFAGISYKWVGLLMFGTFALLVMAACWRQADERREMVWASALFLSFFMLPTQVHERYLYPAVVLLLIAIAQDRRVLPVAFSAAAAYSYNIYAVVLTDVSGTPLLSSQTLALLVVGINVIAFVWMAWMQLGWSQHRTREGARPRLAPSE